LFGYKTLKHKNELSKRKLTLKIIIDPGTPNRNWNTTKRGFNI